MIISDIDAIKILKNDGIVALPTETVYGLAANIYQPNALQKIFITKERPLFDPLIVHVSNLAMAKTLTNDWNELEVLLTKLFWPGPLTLIKTKNDKVSDLITASLPSVAIRVPMHKIMQKVISALSSPLAAPSANKFKSTSPTTAQHVEDEFQGNVAVVDGGECSVGIESTILEVKIVQSSFSIAIYRPGIITKEILIEKLALTPWKDINITYAESHVAPGQLKEHYRPKKPISLFLIEQKKLANFAVTDYSQGQIANLSETLPLAARELYAFIRLADLQAKTKNLKLYFAQEFWNNPAWYPIRERLEKACSEIIIQ